MPDRSARDFGAPRLSLVVKTMRLDVAMSDRELVSSRTQAQAAIERGEVRVNGTVRTKAGFKVTELDVIEVEAVPRYAGRGGFKLEAALDQFGIDPTGLECLDVGASTGGFTDCLLQRGAKDVTAIDVGSGQMIARLCSDPRVTLRENVNARYLASTDIRGPFDLVVIDVSFISLIYVLEPLSHVLRSNTGHVIALIKPQFEVGRERVGAGGIVRNEQHRLEAVESVLASAARLGLTSLGVIPSPIPGGDGNEEFLGLLRRHANEPS